MNKEHLNSNSGFKVPKNYFEGLENQIMSQINLESFTKNSGFKTPEDYFDTIEASVLYKLDKPEPKVFKLITRKTLISVSSVAAAILFSLNVFKTTPTLDNLDTTTVENYILDEIEINDLSLLINDSELSQTDFIDYDIIDIEDYIDDIDLNELYQE